ncbi:Sugar transferase involved in LPS biosynthesis (colanic, teichoic acid) [Parasphingorhabdus marina DSM 22363]|uniref:Sugar transferase involved in LPS biosynthesis (Colanic, teichoic acid) n=1 Tax=Parasphingorhabdus marina DSM 22363 TaxID=1123272 RepID=A0A1N6HQU0_9SPHN|nr:hybrid nucleoside-diphosphate sugar epimerase/sugar transferase [Parasphingorhabdus marina]SIO22100.1 Sugar transferase involved in LPS biosynthesis (colanic, teichoic acid) [Parasphingorhabdus marina DSM 22363]
MKIVVTGASGYIGRHLVPKLKSDGHDLLLVGRSPEQLARLHPDCASCSYDSLEQHVRGYEALVHLAVHNNTSDADLEQFTAVNVGLLKQVFDIAASANIARFVYIASFHDQSGGDPYSVSKAEAADWLDQQNGTSITKIRIPAVYAETFQGKLSMVSKFPKFARPAVLTFARALKPIVAMDLVVATITRSLVEPHFPETMHVSDDVTGNMPYRIWDSILNASFVLVVVLGFWWLLAALWVAIRVTSPGPAIFAQNRVGLHGQVFTCRKFRTMHAGTVQAGTHKVTADSITRIGAVLRRTKLDELPQVWNILRGHVSLIGPRPCLPIQHQLIEERRRKHVLTIKPGITGFAQVRNVDMSDPKRLATVDAQYLVRKSITADIGILLGTLTGRGLGDRVRN